MPATSTESEARDIVGGRCDSAVVYEEYFDSLSSGIVLKRDCDLLKAGVLTADEAQCFESSSEKSPRDCIFQKVGGLIFSIPVSSPIGPRIADGVSWAHL